MSISSQAAPPLLASSLLASAKAHEGTRPLPASSGSSAIDQNALEGGFRYGEITSIAGASGTGKTLAWSLSSSAFPNAVAKPVESCLQSLTYPTHQLGYHAIASHLLTHKLGEIAFIDTTGSFSPLRLRNTLAYRLEAKVQHNTYQESGYVYEKRTSALEKSKEVMLEEATSMLDRVKVMRVFDLAGVVEAVSEVKELMEGMRQFSDAIPIEALNKRDEVGDSEEELDDEVEEGWQRNPQRGCADLDHLPSSEPHSGPIGMIIIDTITNVVSSMMTKSQVQGQALLASFMRSLYHLTSHYHICTILTNAAVGQNLSRNPGYQHGPRENVSIFSSTMGKPALGKTFTFLIDTSVFLSTVPKTSDDAFIAFGDQGDTSSYQKALILEVLKDRSGTREGRWAAFEIAAEVKMLPSG